MACITLTAPPLAMATTELVRAIGYEDVSIRQFEPNLDHKPLRMSWVVVTDSEGNRRLRMSWVSG